MLRPATFPISGSASARVRAVAAVGKEIFRCASASRYFPFVALVEGVKGGLFRIEMLIVLGVPALLFPA